MTLFSLLRLRAKTRWQTTTWMRAHRARAWWGVQDGLWVEANKDARGRAA